MGRTHRSKRPRPEVQEAQAKLDAAHNSVLDAIQTLQNLERSEQNEVRLRSMRSSVQHLNYLDGNLLECRASLPRIEVDRPSSVEQILEQIRRLHDELAEKVIRGNPGPN
jgi:hypothetical protein